jgi:hypothetical protein
VNGKPVKAVLVDYAVMTAVVCIMLLLWALPFMKPFKRTCNRCIYRVFPLITLLNLLIFMIALSQVSTVSFNDIWFGFVKVIEISITATQKCLIAVAASVALVLAWKFKDRIFETLGIDNPALVIGEFRDWATCWSMRRFSTIEVFVWKVEDLPSMHLHQSNDVYVEVYSGYNNSMRTRVHYRGGANCVIKESVQLNHDEFDKNTKLFVTVKNQDVVGASDIATREFGPAQLNRLMAPEKLNMTDRTIGWGSALNKDGHGFWADSKFESVDLVPAGKIWLRIQRVTEV